MAGLFTGGGSDSRRGPGLCGYGGRRQVSGEMPEGCSGIDTSE